MRTKNILKAGIFNLVFQFVLLLAMFWFGLDVRITTDPGIRFLILTTLVFGSALVWVGFFYLQDRREPEPIPYILVAFTAGMAIWALLGYPLVSIVFQTREWIHASLMLFILGSFLVQSSVYSLLLFGVIRFGFMPLKELDEPVDGMVYGAVVGAGYGAVKSLQTLWISPDYTLFAMTYIIATQVLIHSAVGSIMGYLIGQAKFQKQNIPVSSVFGVSVGVVLLGIYHVLNEFLFIAGFSNAFWLSFGFTVAYTLVIFSVCVISMRRLSRGKRTRPKHSRFALRPIMIIYSLVLLVSAALISDYGRRGEKYINENHGISFFYPHTLSLVPFLGSSRDIRLENIRSEILFFRRNTVSPNFQFSLEVRKENGLNNDGLTGFVPVPETENLLVENISIHHRTGKRITFSYLDRPGTDSTEFPVLMKMVRDIIPDGNRLFVFSFRAAERDFDAGRKKYQKILSSVRWKKKRVK